MRHSPEPNAQCRQRVRDARRLLVLDHPFFGMLALRLRLHEDSSADAMWVDGVSLGYNPAFVATLSDAELRGLVCHEVLHVAAGHPWRRGNREHDRFNDACDYAINPIVQDAGMVLPARALVDSAFTGMSAEAIYDRLPAPPPQGAQQPTSESAGASSDSGTEDERSSGGDMPEQQETSGSDGEGECAAQPLDDYGAECEALACPPPPASIGEVRDAPENTPELEAEWKMAVEAAAKTAGSLPGSLVGLIEQARKPTVDWREALRAFVQRAVYSPDYRFSLPNRRYLGSGLYLPALVGENVQAVVIAVDTSGSVSQALLEQFHGEIKCVLEEVKPERTVVVYADYVVQAVAEVVPDDAFVFEAKGRGGTSFIPVFEYVAQHSIDPDCLIYLTDLEGDAPALPSEYPVLWVTPPTGLVPPWGQKVELNT